MIDKRKVNPDYSAGARDLLNRLSGGRGLSVAGYEIATEFIKETDEILQEIDKEAKDKEIEMHIGRLRNNEGSYTKGGE